MHHLKNIKASQGHINKYEELKRKLQYGLVLRRFVLRRFTFTTLVELDRALTTCGVSLSQLKRLFSTYCASRSFPVCTCFLFYFSTFLLRWLWFFHTWRPSRRQKRRKIKTVDVTFFLDVFWTTAWTFFNKIKSGLIDIFFSIICVIFYTLNWLN